MLPYFVGHCYQLNGSHHGKAKLSSLSPFALKWEIFTLNYPEITNLLMKVHVVFRLIPLAIDPFETLIFAWLIIYGYTLITFIRLFNSLFMLVDCDESYSASAGKGASATHYMP